MGYCEVEVNCEECRGTGLQPTGVDEVKEMVRNFVECTKKPCFRMAVKYWHKKKAQWIEDDECLPCPACDGSGTHTKRVWEPEVFSGTYRRGRHG